VRDPDGPAAIQAAPFQSILGPDPGSGWLPEAPAYFPDLHLDQIVAGITAGWEPYDLAPIYRTPLGDLDAIAYRQEVMEDLEDALLFQALTSFSTQMRTMRSHLRQAESERVRLASARWFLEAVALYCGAIESLAHELSVLTPGSRGLGGFREYLNAYCASSSFRIISSETAALTTTLVSIRYSLLINGGTITVRPDHGEEDYGATVEETFRRFQSGAVRRYAIAARGRTSVGMNHVQEQILDRVALLHPVPFQTLGAFPAVHAGYLDETIARFEREAQFYLAYLTYLEPLRRAGLRFCRPRLSRTSKEVNGRECFDLALAHALVREHGKVAPNDFRLEGSERWLIVSGPNNGGKTTFARMFGQMHYLASLGCPVPGVEARLFLWDRLFAHFEREEDIATLRGKLLDDLVRIRGILAEATPNSIVILNEAFSSTTLQDALYLSRQVMTRLSALDLLGVWVTFLVELASFSERTVSVVGTVDPVNPVIRTFRLERRPADGLAYALAIAEKHRVTYSWLKERIE